VNKTTKIIGISVIILLVIGAVLFGTISKHNNAKMATTPEPTATIILATPTSTSKYTPEFRALARAAFIANCKAKVGQQYASACSCGADYLAAHYTDAQLEKAYVEYHTSSKIPGEVQAAYDACKNK